MFVKNKEKIDFYYRKGTYLAVLKAMSVSYVDETKVTAKELLGCYGQRIDIISRDLAQQISPLREEINKSKPSKPVEIVKKEDLNDAFIEKILGEIEGEAGSSEEKVDDKKDTDTTEEPVNKKVSNKSKGKAATKAPKTKSSTRAKATKSGRVRSSKKV